MNVRRLTLAMLCSVVGCALGASLAQAAAPPTIEEEYVTNVAAGSATLRARINPHGIETTYRFEYGPTAGYGSSTTEQDAGAGEGSEAVLGHPQDLLPGTVYHYRMVATNGEGVAEGLDQTFTTQAAGAALELLDGRQWEVVSPQDKHGGGIVPTPFEGGLIQAAEDGNGITYLASSPIDGDPEGNRGPENSQTLALRVPGGWSNRTIDTPHNDIQGWAVGHGSEYRMFSSNLSLAAVEPRGWTPLAPEVTERTQYVRDSTACEAGPTGCFTPLVTSADTAPGAKWGGEHIAVQGDEQFLTASSDLSHVLIKAEEPLTSGAPKEAVYEWAGGQLQLVTILPQGEGGGAVNGEVSPRGNAISSDGSRVVWTSTLGVMYLRDTVRGETIKLSPPAATGVEFQSASPDGSRVLFTAEDGAGSTLYECDIVEMAGGLACDLSEVADGEVQGRVLGNSEDESTVYFAAEGALAGGATPTTCNLSAQETCNLYVAQRTVGGWSIAFIAVVNSSYEQGDAYDWGPGTNMALQVSRVSANGRFLAFMSNRSLTGYDNRDAVSGEPDEEVYTYEAATRELTCVSCNPTGARPAGTFHPGGPGPPLWDRAGVWSNRWVAANVPTWENIDLTTAIYQPRFLSDSGRVFFDSDDALVAQDTNGTEDVYEHEPDGVGSCAKAGGCVQLVSSGASGEESVFLDASASGDDAFFITSARLVSQDQDTAVDVYDAHVCSASVPCVQSAVTPPPCSSGDSCEAAPTPQPSIFGAPSSATFSGAGNVSAPAVKPTSKRVVLTRTQKLARALKACGRQPKRKRAACRKHAHSKYAPALARRRGPAKRAVVKANLVNGAVQGGR
jgi:hypothetical protein